MPLDSGSRGGNCRISQPSTPANAAAGSVSRPWPIPDSLSQTSCLGTAPASCSSDHIPPSRSKVVRVGSILAWMYPENALVITNTGGLPSCPCPSGSGSCGNHKSHCIAWPGSWTSRSTGSAGIYSGRSPRTLSRNKDAEPVQPTRSASTEAGIVGVCTNKARTCAA